MHAIVYLLALITSITPSRTWYPPSEPLTVTVKADGDSRLVLTDFSGKQLPGNAPVEFTGEKSVDLKTVWAQAAKPGTYVLFVVPKGKPLAQFAGTPLLIEARADRREAPAPVSPEVTRVGPLEYAVMTTDKGAMTMAFYYDVAPITVDSFLNLSRTGYFDKLVFHRVARNFVIQGGDPRGADPKTAGSGGPGYSLPAEFNDRPHLPGVLSMARTSDPDSGGSQFFICLDYSKTKSLDHQYTAFGRVTDGMETVGKIGQVPLADPGADDGRPANPPVIEKVQVKPVTAAENPYAKLFHMEDTAGASGK
ncbi:MAG TPA: peptidylprolyl isomerase [Tepidisphaeraceae bacterium]|nr:peptidylprolyl isomerase [Tepidisphaeraceae bacterium]